MALRKGDSVRVLSGTVCPDDPGTDIGLWQGRVTGLQGRGPDRLADIAWDSQTLRGLPRELLVSSDRQGLDWATMTLGSDQIEPATARDSAEDVERTRLDIGLHLPWLQLKPAQIRAKASTRSYSRGQSYAASGSVESLTFQGGRWSARVHGTQAYTVEISGKPDSIGASCSCPYDRGGLCKHVVAVLLTIREEWRARPTGEGHRSGAPAVEPPSGPELLASASLEQLRRFLLLELERSPALLESLAIFLQGSQETTLRARDYQAQIADALEAADFGTDEDLDYDWDRDEWRENEKDTLPETLEPFRDRADRYLAQGNWLEAAKIHEALLRACAESGEEAEGSGSEVKTALGDWAEALGQAPSGAAKLSALERLTGLLVQDPYGLPQEAWQEAIGKAITTAEEARSVLERLGAAGKRALETSRTGSLLRLLELAGDVEAYLRIGQAAVREHPALALDVGRKLLELGRRKEAAAALETALEQVRDRQSYFLRGRMSMELLLRQLVQALDPKKDRARRLEVASELVQLTRSEPYYQQLATLAAADPEGRDLLRQALGQLPAALVLRILTREERWEELLQYARKNLYSDELPAFLDALGTRYPKESFELARDLLGSILRGKGRRSLEKAGRLLLRMEGIPDHREQLLDLVAGLLAERRDPALEKQLGNLARASRERQQQRFRQLFEDLPAERARSLTLEELLPLFSVTAADRTRLNKRRVPWQPRNAALIWALLVQSGGTMEAAALTEAMARARGVEPASAASMRSSGLRMLEALGHAEVQRNGQRLGQVRLIRRE
jgi:hypothetical protein